MKKIAIMADDIMRQLNTKIKTSLDGLKAALKDPTKNSEANISHLVDVAYREIINLTALLPAASSSKTTASVAAMDNEENCSDCPHCGRKMKYSDGRDAYMCVPCGYVGPNGPKKPLFFRKNLDYGER